MSSVGWRTGQTCSTVTYYFLLRDVEFKNERQHWWRCRRCFSVNDVAKKRDQLGEYSWMTGTGSMHMMISKVIIGSNYFGAVWWRAAPHINVLHIPVWLRHVAAKMPLISNFWFVHSAKLMGTCIMWMWLNDRSNSNYMQLILDTQHAPAAGG